MEKIRLKSSDFAERVGCTPKTIYEKIKEPSKYGLVTEIENIGGRKTTFIITNELQIREWQKIYGKLPSQDVVIEQVNEVQYTTEIDKFADRLEKMNDNFQIRLMKVNDELVDYKSKIPLLEEQANREGLYLNDIRELKKEKQQQLQLFTYILSGILLLFTVTLGFLFYKLQNPTIIEKTVVKETIKTVNVPQLPKTKHKR